IDIVEGFARMIALVEGIEPVKVAEEEDILAAVGTGYGQVLHMAAAEARDYTRLAVHSSEELEIHRSPAGVDTPEVGNLEGDVVHTVAAEGEDIPDCTGSEEELEIHRSPAGVDTLEVGNFEAGIVQEEHRIAVDSHLD
ncbi:hypothetical protein P7C71_g5760, partial [Lecanoromycetidae sp. Uapishka_2]